MSLQTARAAILSAFNTAWGNQTPVAWPNTHFDKPQTPWVRITVDGNASQQAGFGSGVLQRHEGVVLCQAFTPTGQGTAEADGYAQDIANALQYKRLTRPGERCVRMDGALFRTIGEADGWHQVNVTIPFDYDEVINP